MSFQLLLDSVQSPPRSDTGLAGGSMFHTAGPENAKLRCPTDVSTRGSWMPQFSQ